MTPPPCQLPGTEPNACAREQYDRHAYGLVRLSGAWRGWRIQGGALIGPGNVRWTPATLNAAMSWQAFGLAGLTELKAVLQEAGHGPPPIAIASGNDITHDQRSLSPAPP